MSRMTGTLGVKAKEYQRRTLSYLVDGLRKGFSEKFSYEKDGHSGGDGISCKGNGMMKMENVCRV